MKVKDILKTKGPEIFTIGETKRLSEAINIMGNNNVGSLMVLNENGKIVGIITERDVLKSTYRYPDTYRDVIISDIMSKNLIIVEPEDEIDYVHSIMSDNRIRHLPVVKNSVLIGIISIGDAVKAQLNVIKHENKYLKDYIEGVGM